MPITESTSAFEIVVDAFSTTYYLALLPCLCMLPSLVSNVHMVYRTVSNRLLSRHLRKLFPVESQICLVITFLVALTNTNRSQMKTDGVYISKDVIVGCQIAAGVLFAAVSAIVGLVISYRRSRKFARNLLVYAVVSFVVKQVLYRFIYGFILLDLHIIYYLEHKRFRRRIFLFGSAIFSMFCSLSYCLFGLVEMKNLHAPNWMLQSFLLFSSAVVLHSAGSYFHLSFTVRKRIDRVMQMRKEEEEIRNGAHIEFGRETVIAPQPGARQSQAEPCPICMEGLSTAPELPEPGVEAPEVRRVNRLECGHAYHQDCIEAWVLNNRSCPLCRNPIRVHRG